MRIAARRSTASLGQGAGRSLIGLRLAVVGQALTVVGQGLDPVKNGVLRRRVTLLAGTHASRMHPRTRIATSGYQLGGKDNFAADRQLFAG